MMPISKNCVSLPSYISKKKSTHTLLVGNWSTQLEAERENYLAKMKDPDVSNEDFNQVMQQQARLDMLVEKQRMTLNDIHQEQWTMEMEREKKICDVSRGDGRKS